MAHSHPLIFVHIVFSTKERAPLIPPERLQQLWAYLIGIARNLKIQMLAVGGISDHVHMLIRIPVDRPLADVIRDFKANSSRWMRETAPHFGWQEGYGAFSVSPSRTKNVIRYIRNQEEHHRKRDFPTEFAALLRSAGADVSAEDVASIVPSRPTTVK